MQREEVCGHCSKINVLYPERKVKFNHTIAKCPKLTGTVCYNCKEYGHTPKYCKKPKSICVLCRHIGHSEEECGYKMQIVNTNVAGLDYSKLKLPDNITIMDWELL